MSVSRLARLREGLTDRRLEAIVVSKPENRTYLSGFTGSTATLLILADRAYLVTDFRYAEQAAAEAPAFDVVIAPVSSFAEIQQRVQQMGVRWLGFEGDFVTVDEHTRYRRLLSDCEFVPATGLVEGLRLIKDDAEMASMRRAAAIADAAWAQVHGRIRPGIMEREVAVELEYAMKRLGAAGQAFDIIVASGARSALPHGRASEKVIETGDFVTVDFGAVYKGYHSDMTRTVVVGQPSERQREIYAIVLEAQQRGVAACRAGITGEELDEVCRSYIRERGYADAFGHGTGHGVGLCIHEDPKVSVRGAADRLEPGMTVTIEPGIYLPGWGGVRIEDLVVVGEHGCERLSLSPTELIML